MVSSAASKIFRIILKITQVTEVCVEEIKVQILLVNHVVFCMMSHNKNWVVFPFNLLFYNVDNYIFSLHT